jgi:FlaA1/EpsC-like NDP-sugar epimerase
LILNNDGEVNWWEYLIPICNNINVRSCSRINSGVNITMKNKKIFITGGAGYLGKKLIKRYYDNNEITIYSRDEAKHYYLEKTIS